MKFTRKEYDAAGIPTRRGEAKAKPPEPMRICSEAEAEEWPQLRARIAALEAALALVDGDESTVARNRMLEDRIAALEAERDRLREALEGMLDAIHLASGTIDRALNTPDIANQIRGVCANARTVLDGNP